MVAVAALILGGIYAVVRGESTPPGATPQQACAANDGHCQASTLLQQRIHGGKVNLDAGFAGATEEHHQSQHGRAQAASKRTRSEDSVFLMQSTFGPTSASLDHISSMSYDAWILEQMALPAEFHRVYYRERVNPRVTGAVLSSSTLRAVEPTTTCSAGSMWHRFAITVGDQGSQVVVDGSTITIGGQFRSSIDSGYTNNGLSAPDECVNNPHPKRPCGQERYPWACVSDSFVTNEYCAKNCFNAGKGYRDLDCSVGWPSLQFSGYICFVEEGIGGLVFMDTSKSCEGDNKKRYTVMKNPAVYVPDSSLVSSSTGTFSTVPFNADIQVLTAPPGSCNHGNFVSIGGVVYSHYPRFLLQGNATVEVNGYCASPDRNFVNEESCVFQPHSCNDRDGNALQKVLLCSSAGEVASVPENGNSFSWFMTDDEPGYTDRWPEASFKLTASPPPAGTSKEAVWATRALKGNDQLRQRMAWALAQILVVGAPNFGLDWMNELWINYYDIFVKHAFGNYRDVLREVSYSPLMGKYLSFRKSYSFDSSGTYADENYAREIMQLFSIGLWKLNMDGTHQTDANGESIPTYSNLDIMDFARVFTGFDQREPRANVEDKDRLKENMIDPMYLRPGKHDNYPKMNLYGGYIGDGYPLCNDIPADKFLEAGARYEIVALDTIVMEEWWERKIMVLSSSSALYAAICGSTAPPCNFQPTVVLESTLSCDGAECSAAASTLDVVKVDNGFFMYIPPACVRMFFYPQGQIMMKQDRNFDQPGSKECVDPALPLAGAVCCAGCSNKPSAGMKKKGKTCEGEPSRFFGGKCNESGTWVTQQICQMRCFQENLGYRDCNDGAYREQRMCSHPRETMTLEQARSTCQSHNMDICYKRTAMTGDSCDFEKTVEMEIWIPETCDGPKIRINYAGQVASTEDNTTTTNNFIRVAWANGFPTVAAGNAPGDCVIDGDFLECPIQVQVKPAFAAVPTPEEFNSQLFIASFAPTAAQTCVDCTGAVKAYSASGGIDADTIFEFEGRYFKNGLSEVSVGSFSFRNPPRFTTPWIFSEIAALNEVEALLDHLANHPNTGPFIARRIIQRFVTSTPSPTYIEDVARAYQTGTYGGTAFSSKHGDLAATIYAVLMHPEARGTSTDAATTGLLREPVLKLMHMLRSLDYVDARGLEQYMVEMNIKVGEWPYRSGRVFNFFLVDFMPADTIANIMAPEFEIFTAPFALGWANGAMEVVEDGLDGCNNGFGMPPEVCNNPLYRNGQLSFTENATVDDTLAELDILLTGGRTSASYPAIREAYDSAPAGHKLQAAEKAFIMSPEFHTLGSTQTTGEREQVTPTTGGGDAGTDYKALIMLYLKGGQDSFNMFVPVGCPLADEYVAVRTTVGLDPSVMQGTTIQASGQPCEQFGIHPELGLFKTWYDEGDLAFVSNVGSLLEPTSMEQWKSEGARLCSGLFSHSDQWQATHSMHCQVSSAKAGFGGLMADVLADNNYTTEAYSIAGLTLWPQGMNTRPLIVDERHGATTFKDYAANADMIWNMTKHKYANAYADAYATKVWDIVESMQNLNAVLETANVTQDFGTTNNPLMKQLYQVARIMSTREARGAKRELFYVEVGGFDAHADDGLADLGSKYNSIRNALEKFVLEMKDQQLWNSVTIMSGSDFGRTLTTNGVGTDHAWAGNGFVLGGDIEGGKIYNQFPSSLAEGGGQDIGRGRLLPLYPLESIYVPVAEWFGITDQADLDYIFPNLKNFNRSSHIVSKEALFKSL